VAERAEQASGPAAAGAAKRRDLKPLIALVPFIRNYPLMALAALSGLLVSSAVMLTIPVAVRRTIDAGLAGADSLLVNSYFAALLGLGLVLALASAGRFYAVNWLGERVVADLRRRAYAHLIGLGPSYHDRVKAGETVDRLMGDTAMLQAASGSSLSQALRNSIMLVGALVMMFATSARLTLVVLAALAGVVLPLLVAGRMVRAKAHLSQEAVAKASGYAGETLGAVRTVQAQVAERAVTARFDAAVEQIFATVKDRLLARAVLTAAAMFLVTASIVGVVWFGASRIMTGDITGGRLGQFLIYAVLAGASLTSLSEVWGDLNQAAAAADRVNDVLALQPAITAPASPRSLPEPPLATLAFEAVTFAYPGRDDSPALRDFDLRVAAGETVALVGPSGAGKSTVLALLLRFFDATSGTVRVDGVPVTDVEPAALRARLALVPQDPVIFGDTVSENIRFGRPEASDTEVRRAAELARADGFVAALPQGYDTVLGERGVTLSGGQRQRIALARAILRDAPVLLLDEATSALDAESEAGVQAALETVTRGRTTLIIAHRLATVQRADRIVVMDQGRIVESGTHASLVAAGGLYARLAKLQFMTGEASPPLTQAAAS
jgi:ATP-binding cassette subfamily B protein